MRKILYVIAIILSIIAIVMTIVNYRNRELINVEEIQTDRKYENVVYDNVEDVWDDSVLGILTIGEIGLNATVKDGTSDKILQEYIGHIEETATYDGNIGLAAHNRGYEKSYFSRINELEIGDIVNYKTKFFERTYVVDNIQVIYETDWSLLESSENNKITMITCITGRPNQRLCVQASEK